MTGLRYSVTPADISVFRYFVATQPAERRRARQRVAILVLVLPFAVLALSWALGGFRPMPIRLELGLVGCVPSARALLVVAFRRCVHGSGPISAS